MTEREWLECDDPQKLLDFARNKTSDRKLRLFGVFFLQHGLIRNSVTDPLVQNVIRQVQGGGDGTAARAEVMRHCIGDSYKTPPPTKDPTSSIVGIVLPPTGKEQSASLFQLGVEIATSTWPTDSHETRSGIVTTLSHHALALLRHIIGNPFRPYAAPGHWPSHVSHLANALYNGADCGFALHDALLEAGHPELADHFRQEPAHPKGCWVVDLLLQKS